jgi:hypothetical protein
MEAGSRSRPHMLIIRLWQESLPSGRACWRGTISDARGELCRPFEGKNALLNEVLNLLEGFAVQREKGGDFNRERRADITPIS